MVYVLIEKVGNYLHLIETNVIYVGTDQKQMQNILHECTSKRYPIPHQYTIQVWENGKLVKMGYYDTNNQTITYV